MMQSGIPTPSGHRRCRARHAVHVVAVGVAFCGLVGCASGRKAELSPRIRDEASLRTEAQARPADAEPLYQMALLHYGLQEPEPALHALQASLRRDANYTPSLALLAKLLHDAGRSAEGVKWFESRPLDDLADPVRLNVALLYADIGNTLKARRILKGLVQGQYADAANVNLAYLDLVDEQNLAAVRALEQQAARYQDVPEVENNLALAKLRAGDVEGATHILKDLAAQHPDFAPAQLNLALLLRNYLFDEDGAAHAQAHFDELGAPKLSPAAVQAFIEDASPPPPEFPAPPAAAQPAEKKP